MWKRERVGESEMGDSADASRERAKSTVLDSIGWTSLFMLGHALPTAVHIKYCVKLDFISPAADATINLALRLALDQVL